MNLLLLLSALLSALTGVGAGVRDARGVQAVAEQSVAVRVAVSVERRVTVRPAAALASLARSARAPLANITEIAAAVPLYASRRRE